MSASDRIKRRALNSAVECHLHTVEVIGSNPIAPTIFSITCKLPCRSRGSIWVQQAHDTALGPPFRWRHCLNVFVHRDADICMAHERLHNSHIFTVSLEQSTERMAKRMPANPNVWLSRLEWQLAGCGPPSRCLATRVVCRPCRLTRIYSLMAGSFPQEARSLSTVRSVSSSLRNDSRRWRISGVCAR